MQATYRVARHEGTWGRGGLRFMRPFTVTERVQKSAYVLFPETRLVVGLSISPVRMIPLLPVAVLHDAARERAIVSWAHTLMEMSSGGTTLFMRT